MTTGTDNFVDLQPGGLESPATKAVAITPHATNELAAYTRAIYVGGAGNINMTLQGDSAAVSFVGVLAGTVIPVRAKVVLVTGTTATNLVGLS